MKLKIITPEITLFDGSIKSINIAEKAGSFSILTGHAPLLTVIKDFVSTIQSENGELSYIAVGFGILKVLNNEIALTIDDGAIGTSKEEAKNNLAKLREEITQNNVSLGDDTIANLEVELMRRMQELGG